MIISEKIREAIRRAAENSGSPYRLSKTLGIRHTTIRDWLSGKTKSISDGNWERVRTVVGNLPDEVRGPYSRGEVAETIKRWMKAANLTQQELASRLKISQSLLSRQILGKEKMPSERLRQIISVINPPVDEVAEMLGQFKRAAKGRGRERRYLISLLYFDRKRGTAHAAETYGTFIGLSEKSLEDHRKRAAAKLGVPVKNVVILSAMALEE